MCAALFPEFGPVNLRTPCRGQSSFLTWGVGKFTENSLWSVVISRYLLLHGIYIHHSPPFVVCSHSLLSQVFPGFQKEMSPIIKSGGESFLFSVLEYMLLFEKLHRVLPYLGTFRV